MTDGSDEITIQFEPSVPADLFARICVAIDDYRPGAVMEFIPSRQGVRAKFYLPPPDELSPRGLH